MFQFFQYDIAHQILHPILIFVWRTSLILFLLLVTFKQMKYVSDKRRRRQWAALLFQIEGFKQ